MMGKKKNFLIILVCLVMLSMAVFPAPGLADSIESIAFKDLEEILLENSRQIQDNDRSIPSSYSPGAQKAALEAQVDMLQGIFGDDPAAAAQEPKFYAWVQMQILSLEQQIAALERSSGSDDSVLAALAAVQARNAGFIYGMESLFINVKNMEQQIILLDSRLEQGKAQVKAMELRYQTGMVTEDVVKQVANQIEALEFQRQTLQKATDGLIEQLNISIGNELNDNLKLAELEEITDAHLTAIRRDQDFKAAFPLSNSIELADRSGNSVVDAEKTFEMNFNNTHQNVMDKKKALDIERANMGAAERAKTIADIKYSLGMMSALDYEEAKNAHLSSRVALTTAENALFQAYHQYQWALRGFTFN